MGPERFHWSFWSRMIECDIRGGTFFGRKVDDLEEKIGISKRVSKHSERVLELDLQLYENFLIFKPR